MIRRGHEYMRQMYPHLYVEVWYISRLNTMIETIHLVLSKTDLPEPCPRVQRELDGLRKRDLRQWKEVWER